MKLFARRRPEFRTWGGLLALGSLMAAPITVLADEGGVGLWVPGFFGNFAASPLTPGFSYANTWLTFAISPAAQAATKPAASRPMFTK